MAIGEGLTPRKRRGVMALVMLLVLGMAVLAAKLFENASRARLQAESQARAKVGAEILRQIRARGLGSLYGPLPRTQWYLLEAVVESGGGRARTIQTQLIGWRANHVRRDRAGDFIGVTLEVSAPAGVAALYVDEIWQLNADATAGLYSSQVAAGQRERGMTEIIFQDGVVDLTQPQLKEHVRSPAPPNYLPEGTLEVAVGLVARQKAPAEFKMVFNLLPNPRGTVEFGVATMRPAGPRVLRGGVAVNVVEVRRTRLDQQDGSDIYEVSESGRIVSVSSGGLRQIPVDEADVLSRFPDALQRLEQLVQAAPSRLPTRHPAALPEEEYEVQAAPAQIASGEVKAVRRTVSSASPLIAR